jgi:hypothetical protein
MKNAQVICVLGPLRSGTSMITKILSFLGIYLGSQENFDSSPIYNIKGTWEHILIREINDNILLRIGRGIPNLPAGPTDPPVFPLTRAMAYKFKDLLDHAQLIIEKEFADVNLWGWKDPRNCFTLPFWQILIPQMEYVICLRHPLNVASSIKRFIKCSYEKGIYLWLLHLKFALAHTNGHRRIFICYENFLKKEEDELERLLLFFKKSGLKYSSESKNAVMDYIDPKMCHHHVPTIDSLIDTEIHVSSKVLSLAEQIYDALIQEGSNLKSDINKKLEKALDIIGPEVIRQEVFKFEQWLPKLQRTIEGIHKLFPQNISFILVDQEEIRSKIIDAGLNAIPFLERNGHYWGPPPDDETAIKELERSRSSGAQFIVFIWPTFWWLDHYSEFNQYINSKYRLIQNNNQLIVFDLRL